MNIAICEDVPTDAAEVSILLNQYEKLHPGVRLDRSFYSSGPDLLDAVEDGAVFDLYLLDILMAGCSGIDLARKLRERGDRGRIVFLTSSPDYALSAFSVNAAGYLLKPVTGEQLFSALDQALEELALRHSRHRAQFAFRTPGGLRTVALSDLIYVEVMGHVPFFHLTKETLRGSEMRISFEDSMGELIKSGCFLRPHRSFLVNAAHITNVTSRSLQMDNGALVPVARVRSAEIKERYLDYLMKESPSYD